MLLNLIAPTIRIATCSSAQVCTKPNIDREKKINQKPAEDRKN